MVRGLWPRVRGVSHSAVRYANRSSSSLAGLLLLPLLGLPACVAPPAASLDAPTETTDATRAALGEATVISFDAAFQQSVSGSLEKGKAASVVYDDRRLTACRGDQAGVPQWSITGYYTVGGGPVRAFEAGGLSPSGGTAEPTLLLDRSGDLQIWFQNTSRWGCSAYDSSYGANYHFTVAPAPGEPGWMGNVRYAINRMTCDGGPCESSLYPFTTDVIYETYARQRAAIRVVQFEVWKEGVTDHDDPDLWKKLDVQVHSRVSGASASTTRYVSFDRRVGNNARYAIDLRDLDSVPGSGLSCPPYPVTYVPGTNETYVEAPVDFYVTVNGAELRPEGAATFRVRYQNYADLYTPCITP